MLQFQETGKPVYKVKNVNLNTLCDHYGAPCNPLKEQLKNIYRKDQRYWSRRPMTRDMLIYASSDVLSLVPQVYNAMSRYSFLFIIFSRIINSRYKLITIFIYY